LSSPASNLKFAPVLVTGGTGFLGRRLVERLLSEGRRVTILGRTPAPDLEQRGVRFIRASLDDAPAIYAACAGIETIFHVAAKVGVWGRYEDFHRINVLGTLALLEGARAHGVARFVYTSTPSVVYDGRDHAGADESLPLTTNCPSPYPLTKAIAEREVLTANSDTLRTIALRPHLIWGVGDPHLVPRVLARARAGRLRIVGSGRNRVDMVHVENAVDAHLLAERALVPGYVANRKIAIQPNVSGQPFFITNDEPVALWEWINALLLALGESPIERRISLGAASVIGGACEIAWRLFNKAGEPPMTRFIAAELAKDHWFNIAGARHALGYVPRISMAQGTAELIEALRKQPSCTTG
jgi:nucleoside-diphosphate-sugar epimerase